MPTIYDVARAAGVSPKTVSRVLNDEAPVNDKTRSAVRAAMRRLGYVPSRSARSLRSQRSGLIGLVTGAISITQDQPAGLPDMLIVQGVQRVLSERQMTLMVADTGGDMAKVPELVRTFLEHGWKGSASSPSTTRRSRWRLRSEGFRSSWSTASMAPARRRSSPTMRWAATS